MWQQYLIASLAVMAAVTGFTAAAVATVQLDQDTAAQLKNLQQTVESLGRQMMQQQTFVEERIRSDGMSGIKTLRHQSEGTRPYYGDHHIGGAALSAHDHADYDRTIGLGEFVAVMNGVDFRTRHNDYKFKMPSRTSKNFNSVEDVPFPEVPPAVKNKRTVQEQIDEMRLWFKAFKEQDYSVRDYRKYFKPNLCYLEGGWTLNSKTLDEPFESDRHHLDATSWFDLQEKIRWTSYAGSKSNLENFAFLPTVMYNITDGIPQYAQWNYRIVCHPLKQDVPTSYLKVQDDLSTRLRRKYRWDKMENQRAARFKINEFGTERNTQYTLMDSIMAEIPGKDNYGTNISDAAFGLMTYDISKTGYVPLNAGHYHRWYKVARAGAMGLQINHRGFRDENMWMAMTTQRNIMPLTVKRCQGRNCVWETRRVTYAIPLEMIYSTPLSNWNPYNLELKQESIVSRNGRSGGSQANKAFNGTSTRHFYRTPVEFYHGGTAERDAADTARNGAGVLDRKGEVKQCAPTGFRIMTPSIDGVGAVRLRYPIFPVHSEGSTVGMEIDALKRAVMQMSTYSYLYEEIPLGQPLPVDDDVTFHVRDSYRNPPGLHGHDFTITAAEHKAMLNGTELQVTTTYNLAHNHQLTIYYNKNNQRYLIRKCDDDTAACWDGHSSILTRVRV
ncbi:hypothetical protein PoB_006906900 [Plakobranchus ocellatus]|uniref:Uncharacterized protein n=1 Tax=Plakobranchus ocellatus TaxID=259542 RepID=A0AAV4DEE5_9GAST|nr:hypothetical protein PoB_006906900 [Plakobranchus ocellatus]